MEPISLAAIALTATITKTVDELGDGAIASAKQLVALLKARRSESLKQLAAAEGSADSNVIEVEVLEEELRAAAQADPAVDAAVKETAAAMQQQFGAVVNKGKLAEKIGLLVQGNNNTIDVGGITI